MGKNIHVVPKDGGWDVSREGGQRASSHHATQAEAIEAATAAAKRDKVELLVHGKDGQIRLRNSFGNDPTRSKG
ncbi:MULTISPECIES: DUF2188 domain-containing protein [Cupriavidus]|jgi:hypothetical protein|uniref:DUF2188 domain-containing protein n=3 Tax=Pseudomonadota TaxID=1224 RepID=A0A7Z7JGD4_9BURK|nr:MULTISPECIES: DUF2188 domain-containing protein [Cupriavidus]NOV27830.1 DUF2188 domain-containing protein [Cupriavidus necator]NSX14014.1 DUF2188 domain-containing protein [Cupriavidus taiwanensis]QEZ48649.1 DUF2188 domain-containing protein [Cupriavidus oxalaticus]SOZ18584.1 conserved hypothetical protein [Cupriavidus taiwanensis]SOZ96722.1 conserved hypothetical protein [Cupriavidus taiwanensis]